MKWSLLTATLCAVGGLSGCAALSPSGDFCDKARPIYMGSEAVLDWLLENDEPLLRGVVSHNEITAKCP